jgi:hypothetical protein
MKWLMLLLFGLFLAGCTVTQTVYLQDASIKGPIQSPPLNILENSRKDKIIISPKFHVAPPKPILTGNVNHTRVNANGVYQVDSVKNSDDTYSFTESNQNTYPFQGSNLRWNVSDFYGGLDVNIPWGKTSRVNLGFSIARENGESLLGGSLGLGLCSIQDQGSFTFSFGLNYQQMAYDLTSVVKTDVDYFWGGSSSSVLFFHDRGKAGSLGFYLNLLYNSSYEGTVNFYMGGGYLQQTLLSYKPNTLDPNFIWPFMTVNDIQGDESFSKSLGFLSLTPGLFFKVSDDIRFVAGANLLYDIGDAATGQMIVIPSFRFDFAF